MSVIRDLTQKERTAFDKRVVHGRALLAEAGHRVGDDALAAAQAIAAARSSAVDVEALVDLGALWLECAAAASAWRVRAWPAGKKGLPMLFSPAHDVAIMGEQLIRIGANKTHGLGPDAPVELMRAVLEGGVQGDLHARYAGCGIVKPSKHLGIEAPTS